MGLWCIYYNSVELDHQLFPLLSVFVWQLAILVDIKCHMIKEEKNIYLYIYAIRNEMWIMIANHNP